MADYGSQNIRCPFYKGSDEKNIRCEGVVSPICIQRFRSVKRRSSVIEFYCASDYQECRHYKSVIQKAKYSMKNRG